MDLLQCLGPGCDSTSFQITERSMVGEDDPYIDDIICAECGTVHADAPSPTAIRLPNEYDS